MKYVPNILSAARIALAGVLLLVKPLSVHFFIIYLICGVTDIFDGIIARRFKATSALGSRLDSIGDVLLTLIVLYIILPIIQLPVWLLMWILLIIVLRFVSVGIAIYRYRKPTLLHTIMNRAVAMALFLFPFSLLFLNTLTIPIILTIVASIAAIEEVLIMALAPTLDPNVKSYRAAFPDNHTRAP